MCSDRLSEKVFETFFTHAYSERNLIRNLRANLCFDLAQRISACK